MWIPNFLTSIRICTAVAFPLVPVEFRISLAILSLLTEFLDGKIARMFYWETNLGKVLDPIADKFFALAFGIVIIGDGTLSLPEFIFLISRDLLVGFGFIIALSSYRNGRVLQESTPNWIGKVTTGLQYFIFLYILVLGRPHFWAILFVGTWSLLSGVIYIFKFQKHIHEKP